MHRLWYEKPARSWHEALPLGNGKSGVMLTGGTRRETLFFNDCTLWSGYPKDHSNPQSLANLQRVRDLIFAGKNHEADELAMQTLCGDYSEAFMPLGALSIRFKLPKTASYRRELDLARALHSVTQDGVTRECFASYPDKVVVYRITSDEPFALSIHAKSKLKSEICMDNALNLLGNAPDYAAPNYLRGETRPIRYNEGKAMSFCLRCEADTDGTVSHSIHGLHIKLARRVTLYLTTATGFRGWDSMPCTERMTALNLCKEQLRCVTRDFDTLLQRHLADYCALYEKQSMSLNEEEDAPTVQLLARAKKGEVSNALCELFYNYAKYLMISGSRAGGEALNLQGIWNKDRRPAWSSNYTTNINAQMNYWGATASNLADCLEPYIRMVRELVESGKRTARVNLGCAGFACNHNADIWRKTTPVKGSPAYMYEPLCGVWLANEVYAHYRNAALLQYRETVEDILREAATFASDYLLLHDGHYVICPSPAPEQDFLVNGKRCMLDWASSFDMGLVRQLFSNYLELQPQGTLAESIREKLPLLHPFGHGSTGLLEFHADVPVAQKGHRHFSPLYAFFPGDIIRPRTNPVETAWVKELFDYRIAHAKQHIGWSAAWAACIAARLGEGDRALGFLSATLRHSVFPNLFGVHHPRIFQIDGNLGALQSMNEMLLQSEDDVIALLPALPKQWANGSVHGMLCRGASLSFAWENGLLTEICSDTPVRLRGALAPRCRVSDTVTLIEED